MSECHYDVVIIGAGPAGLFAANELKRASRDLKILIIEQGKPPESRQCAALTGNCIKCNPCQLVHGGAGAGLFSDGKLVLDLNFGGHLSLPEKDQLFLVNYIKNTLQKYDGNAQASVPSGQEAWRARFSRYDLELKTYRILHLGSANLQGIMRRFIADLMHRGVDFWFNAEALSVEANNSIKKISVLKDNRITSVDCSNLVIAAGKAGSGWVRQALGRLGVQFSRNRVFIGVRIETGHRVLREMLDFSFDPKIFHYFADGAKIKTHCFCRQGQVIMTRYGDSTVVGGHTRYTEKNRLEQLPEVAQEDRSNSNFAVLLGDTPDHPFSQADIKYYLDAVRMLAGGRLLVQRLADFRNNVATTPQHLASNLIHASNTANVVPGNIAALNLPLDFNYKFAEFMNSLNQVVPGIGSDETLLYAPAVEWWMDKAVVDQHMETIVPGLYAIGDGAGLSQGIVHAGATGILAASGIVQKKLIESRKAEKRLEQVTA